MLAPMWQAKGYDDRLILDGISRDAPIEESYLDRIPRDELQPP
jgi:hypothetical protein